MYGLGAVEIELRAQVPSRGLTGVVWGELRFDLAFELSERIHQPDKGVAGIPNRVKRMCKGSEV